MLLRQSFVPRKNVVSPRFVSSTLGTVAVICLGGNVVSKHCFVAQVKCPSTQSTLVMSRSAELLLRYSNVASTRN